MQRRDVLRLIPVSVAAMGELPESGEGARTETRATVAQPLVAEVKLYNGAPTLFLDGESAFGAMCWVSPSSEIAPCFELALLHRRGGSPYEVKVERSPLPGVIPSEARNLALRTSRFGARGGREVMRTDDQTKIPRFARNDTVA
jgi:hypothetical protein